MGFNFCFNLCFRESDDQKRLIQEARQRYEEIVGKENSFAKEITSVIDNYVSLGFCALLKPCSHVLTQRFGPLMF